MNREALAELLTVVSNLPAGSAPPWSAGTARIYKIGLRDVPDAAAAVLAEAIVDTCTFRPTVHEIKALWRKIGASSEAVTPETVIAQLFALRDRYGEFAVAHPDLPGVRVAGEPLWTDPVKRRVIAAMGGWVNFCRDESPSGVQRGQLYRIAQSAIGGDDDATIERLRLEYQEQVRALVPRAPERHDEPPLGAIEDEGDQAARMPDGQMIHLGDLRLRDMAK